jgi:excisionase family DNA binding protein
MDTPTPKTGALDSTPAFTLTEGQLRKLIREEVQATLFKLNGAISNAAPGGSQKPYLTVKEAADLGRLALSTVRLYIRQRKIKAQKVGRRVIIAREGLEDFLSRNPIEVRSQ